MSFYGFNEEEIKNFFYETKNVTEFCRKCGLHSINGESLKDARDFLEKIGLRYKTEKEKYLENPKKCKNCEKIIPYEKRENDIFCSRSCACSYNNKTRIITEEQKKKISNALKGKTKEQSTIEKMLFSKYYKKGITPKQPNKKKKIYSCFVCNKKIGNNKTGLCRNCLNNSEQGKKLKSETTKKLMEEGRIKSWTSRNIISYPECFWKTVLNNNNIQYSINEYFKPYFLDFFIKKGGVNIDLEIDGKQHNIKERKESDKKRDIFLKENCFIVYRVKWNEVNTDKGKKKMKEKIDSFLSFYSSL